MPTAISEELKKKIKYYSKDSKCPKCGCDVVSAQYKHFRTILCGVLDYDREIVRRVCSDCGYMWDELPVNEDVR